MLFISREIVREDIMSWGYEGYMQISLSEPDGISYLLVLKGDYLINDSKIRG